MLSLVLISQHILNIQGERLSVKEASKLEFTSQSNDCAPFEHLS
jgi:hypothetical protein